MTGPPLGNDARAARDKAHDAGQASAGRVAIAARRRHCVYLTTKDDIRVS